MLRDLCLFFLVLILGTFGGSPKKNLSPLCQVPESERKVERRDVNKCSEDSDCSLHWPNAYCVRGRCKCPDNYLRKKSLTREWICLAVNDVATGQIGPPLTCPLPEGAGYGVILRDNGRPVLCNSRSKKKECPDGYECIQGNGIPPPKDGACCPDRGTTCIHPIFDHPEDGHINRYGFDGTDCIQFKWNPERPSSANNFATKEQCEDYCINNRI